MTGAMMAFLSGALIGIGLVCFALVLFAMSSTPTSASAVPVPSKCQVLTYTAAGQHR